MNLRGVVMALAASCLAGAGLAAQVRPEQLLAPPNIPVEPASVHATLQRPPSLGVSLGSLHVRFEETTLEDVRRQIGVGSIVHRGDAGDSLSWLCYTIPDGKQSVRLWMTSGELQGNKYVGGITAEVSAAGTQPVASCPLLPAGFRQIALDQSLWIGAPDAHVRAVFGKPSHEAQGWRMFDYAKPINQGQCEQQSWLWTKSKAGRVVLIDAGLSSSC